MKRIKVILIISLLVCTFAAKAQYEMVAFKYDADGNRTSVSYTVMRLYDNGICGDTIGDVSSSENNTLESTASINVYPNPTTGYIVLSSDIFDMTNTVHAKLYSLQGDIIEDRIVNSNRTDFDLSNCPAGLYFMAIIYNEERLIWEIVKK